MYSNIQGRAFCLGNGLMLLISLFSITTISPFSTSLTNFAPTMSNAQVSDARIYDSFNLPITRGLIPKGSPVSYTHLRAHET